MIPKLFEAINQYLIDRLINITQNLIRIYIWTLMHSDFIKIED